MSEVEYMGMFILGVICGVMATIALGALLAASQDDDRHGRG